MRIRKRGHATSSITKVEICKAEFLGQDDVSVHIMCREDDEAALPVYFDENEGRRVEIEL